MASDGTRILMLHRVLDDAATAFGVAGCYRMRGTALTLDELECGLDKAGPILPLVAVERALALGEEPPAGSVLTFDDGYREHLDVVAPLLAARGVSATFYVATGLHGDGGEVGVVDAWYWLLDHAQRPEVEVPLPDGGRFRGRLDTSGGKAEWVTGPPKSALLAATPAQQRTLLRALAGAVDCALPDDLARRLYLRAREWDALRVRGMQVGAHSVSHPRLTQVSTDGLSQEVGSSVARLANSDGRVPFAYPDGAFDERVVAAVTRARASSAVTCEAGTVGRETPRMRLPRILVRPAGARNEDSYSRLGLR